MQHLLENPQKPDWGLTSRYTSSPDTHIACLWLICSPPLYETPTILSETLPKAYPSGNTQSAPLQTSLSVKPDKRSCLSHSRAFIALTNGYRTCSLESLAASASELH